MNLPQRRPLFFPYLLADFPDRGKFKEALDLTLQHADFIEIGIPFSDPVADGPVIQQASAEVLSRGFRLESLLSLLRQTPRSVPAGLMTYANPVLAYGLEHLLQACRECGIQALIVPDVPHEEAGDWRAAARQSGIAWIPFVSLQTSGERLRRIAESAEGFVYLLSLTGITGASIRSTEAILAKALAIKRHTPVPVALGFGIKSAQDAVPFHGTIDAFIVGSRIVEALRSGSLRELEQLFAQFRTPQDSPDNSQRRPPAGC